MAAKRVFWKDIRSEMVDRISALPIQPQTLQVIGIVFLVVSMVYPGIVDWGGKTYNYHIVSFVSGAMFGLSMVFMFLGNHNREPENNWLTMPSIRSILAIVILWLATTSLIWVYLRERTRSRQR